MHWSAVSAKVSIWADEVTLEPVPPVAHAIGFESKDRSLPDHDWRHHPLSIGRAEQDDACDADRALEIHDIASGG